MDERKRKGSYLAPLFFFLLPILPLWKTLFFGLCIGPFDQIRQMAPWNGPRPDQPWDVLQADGVLQFYPWRHLVLDSWASLRPPFWNPFELGGTPLLANSQSGGFYPLHILLGILHFPTPAAIVLLAWLHLGWAGLGVFYLCRRLGGAQITSAIGGASFTLSPFMLSWTALASVIGTVSWIPWCLLFAVRTFERGSVRRSILGLSLCVAMMVLAGHLQFVAYGLMAIAVVSFGCLWGTAGKVGTRTALFGSIVLSLVIGLMLAAPQLAPVLAFSKHSNRLNTPTEQGYESYVSSAIQPFELANLANPLALGNPREAVDDRNPSLSTYWPALVKKGGNFAESALTVGFLVLAFLPFVNWKNRANLAIAMVGGLALLVCLGTPINKLLYNLVPGWSATGSPGRICVVFVLAACVLAGTAQLRGAERATRKIGASGICLLMGLTASLVLPKLAPDPNGRLVQLVQGLQGTATVGGAIGLLGFLVAGACVFLLTRKHSPKVRALALAGPMLIAALSGGLDLVTVGKPLATIDPPPNFQRVAYLNRSWDILQVPHAEMPPNTASISGIHELAGYDSLLDGQTVELLRTVNGEDPAPPANGNMMLIKNSNEAGLSEAGVTLIGTGVNLKPLPGAPGRVSFTGGPAAITAEDLSSVTLSAEGEGILTLRDRNMGGWTVQVDGRTAEIESGTWRVLHIVGKGRHLVRFTYMPPGLTSGLALFAGGLLLLLGVGPFFRIRKFDPPSDSV